MEESTCHEMVIDLSKIFNRMECLSTFSKNSFRNMIRVSNSSDPDQVRCSVGPDLGPKCLQKLSADDNRR